MDIIQLKITLLNTKPPIWRRILIPKSFTFEELHNTIQVVMGWENYHLHEFNIGRPEQRLEEFFTPNQEIERFDYLYDFGDYWEHSIEVEKFIRWSSRRNYPICTGGKLNCPPEDCGGISGFYQMLDILSQKRHPEKREYIEWLGGKYDPKYFDKDEINENIKNFGLC